MHLAREGGGDIMITRRDLIVAVLCTFCLTMVLFTATPVKSTGSNYDPWVDANHDGKINVLDLIKVALSLDTSGDPALNVTVTNMPPEVGTLVWYNTVVNQLGITSSLYNVKGYAHLNLMGTADITSSDTVTVLVEGTIWNATHAVFQPIIVYSRILTSYPSNSFSVNIPVPSANFYFRAYASSSTYHLSLSFYATWT
jgi:hypothetical protein